MIATFPIAYPISKDSLALAFKEAFLLTSVSVGEWRSAPPAPQRSAQPLGHGGPII
ncbi:hypothetical protein KIN20_022002 [Parelaphostrongylus tenuis]|uniref:Uncharacterized protein n=1 Tax=Parelaphostrongylus tenuis TaxID=148309 RepID=A0AAD5QV31_PARTN|nr:hypothetical protein KIN20_022002 [Parelaphostrongylus tenuis]